MKRFIPLLVLILLITLLQSFLPWYGIVLAGLLFGALFSQGTSGQAFAYGILAGFIVWSGYSAWINSGNDSILATRFGVMLGGLGPWTMVILTGLAGGIYAGLAAWVGNQGRRLFSTA